MALPLTKKKLLKNNRRLIVVLLFLLFGLILLLVQAREQPSVTEERSEFYVNFDLAPYNLASNKKVNFTLYAGESYSWGISDKKELPTDVFRMSTRGYSFEGKFFIRWLVIKRDKNTGQRSIEYYYAALPKDETLQLPQGDFSHYYLYLYFSPVFYDGMLEGSLPYQFPEVTDLETSNDADRQTEGLYYQVKAQRPGEPEPDRRPRSGWIALEGIRITEAQSKEIVCQSIHLPECIPFLHEGLDNLTRAQKEYIRKHPISKADFSKMIERLNNRPSNPWK